VLPRFGPDVRYAGLHSLATAAPAIHPSPAVSVRPAFSPASAAVSAAASADAGRRGRALDG
jgi:hypothetical protein